MEIPTQKEGFIDCLFYDKLNYQYNKLFHGNDAIDKSQLLEQEKHAKRNFNVKKCTSIETKRTNFINTASHFFKKGSSVKKLMLRKQSTISLNFSRDSDLWLN